MHLTDPDHHLTNFLLLSERTNAATDVAALALFCRLGVSGGDSPALWLRAVAYSVLTVLYCIATSRFIFKVRR